MLRRLLLALAISFAFAAPISHCPSVSVLLSKMPAFAQITPSQLFRPKSQRHNSRLYTSSRPQWETIFKTSIENDQELSYHRMLKMLDSPNTDFNYAMVNIDKGNVVTYYTLPQEYGDCFLTLYGSKKKEEEYKETLDMLNEFIKDSDELEDLIVSTVENSWNERETKVDHLLKSSINANSADNNSRKLTHVKIEDFAKVLDNLDGLSIFAVKYIQQ